MQTTDIQQAIPRRIQQDQWTPAEHAIAAAVKEVENAGVSIRLTKVVLLLTQAQNLLADHVDNIPYNEDSPENENVIYITERELRVIKNAEEEIEYLRKDNVVMSGKLSVFNSMMSLFNGGRNDGMRLASKSSERQGISWVLDNISKRSTQETKIS